MINNNNLQKGSSVPLIVAMVAVALVLGTVAYYTNQSETAEDKMEQEKATMEKKDELMMKEGGENVIEKEEGAVVDKGETMMKYSGTTLAAKSAPLLDFVKADYEAALKTDKLLVLYFYANWCPICIAEFPKMQEVFNELNTDKVVGFRVNYNDNQTDSNEENLAKEFGVAYQHTKVFVKNGQRILKSPEGWDDKRYDTEINKALTQ